MYLMAGRAATDAIKSGDVVLVGIPGTTVLTPTRVGQLYRGKQLVYPGIQMLMQLGNAGTVAGRLVQNMPWLYAQIEEIKEKAEERPLEADTQPEALNAEIAALIAGPVSRARLFLDYTSREGISGVPSDVSIQIQSSGKISEASANVIAEAVYNHIREEQGANASVKDDLRDYIMHGKADEGTLSFLAQALITVLHKNSELARQYEAVKPQRREIVYELEQIGSLQIVGNGVGSSNSPHRLEELVQAVSAIKSGNVNGDASGGVNIYGLTSWMIRMLVGVEPGKQFLCPIDEVVEKSANNKMLSPFNFNAANGTNVPDEFKRNYLPAQELILQTKALHAGLVKILLAYISAVKRPYDDSNTLLGAVARRLMPRNPAIQTVYADDQSEVQGNNSSTNAIADRALESFKNGEMANVAAKQLGISERRLTQKGLEDLVLVLDCVMSIVPMEFYRFSRSYLHLVWLEEGLRTRLQEPRRRLIRKYESERSANAVLRRTLQSQFGVDVEYLPNFMTRLDTTIELFGEERIGFIRKVLATKAV